MRQRLRALTRRVRISVSRCYVACAPASGSIHRSLSRSRVPRTECAHDPEPAPFAPPSRRSPESRPRDHRPDPADHHLLDQPVAKCRASGRQPVSQKDADPFAHHCNTNARMLEYLAVEDQADRRVVHRLVRGTDLAGNMSGAREE